MIWVKAGATGSPCARSLRDAGRVGFQPTAAKQMGHTVGWNPTLRRSASKVRKGDAGVWQRRFWGSAPDPKGDWSRWTNRGADGRSPRGEHGFVGRPEEWPYSSVHRDARYVAGMDLGLPPER